MDILWSLESCSKTVSKKKKISTFYHVFIPNVLNNYCKEINKFDFEKGRGNRGVYKLVPLDAKGLTWLGTYTNYYQVKNSQPSIKGSAYIFRENH